MYDFDGDVACSYSKVGLGLKPYAREVVEYKSRMRPAILLKKSLWHRCFRVNFAKFQRAPFLQNTSGRLLLPVHFNV